MFSYQELTKQTKIICSSIRELKWRLLALNKDKDTNLLILCLFYVRFKAFKYDKFIRNLI